MVTDSITVVLAQEAKAKLSQFFFLWILRDLIANADTSMRSMTLKYASIDYLDFAHCYRDL